MAERSHTEHSILIFVPKKSLMAEMYYPTYLQLDKILNAQSPESAKQKSAAHDEMLFIVVHQVYELWFKQMLFELNSVRDIFVRTVFIDALPTETYCTGKTTSQGLVPFITFDGFPSVVNTNALPFRIIGNDLVPGEAGIILFSFQKSELAFHGGKLCIKAPVRKLFPVKQVQPDGTILRNLNNVLSSPPDPMMTVGQKVYCQWRISDPTNPSGFGDALTDAVRFTISP